MQGGHASSVPARHLPPPMASAPDSAEANFANSLLPGMGGEDGGMSMSQGGPQDANLLMDNHTLHFPGPTLASPSLFTGVQRQALTSLCRRSHTTFSSALFHRSPSLLVLHEWAH